MAGSSNEQQLSLSLYNSLQSLGCPLVDGLYLKEAESVQELLCTPSFHRTDILKWICSSISPSLKKKFSNIKPSQNEDLTQDLVQFGYEMMLCKPTDYDLIKGLAPPMRQLKFLEQLLLVLQEDSAVHSRQMSSSRGKKKKNLLGELFSHVHLTDLDMLMNVSCNPWPAHIRDHLMRAQSANNSVHANHSKSFNNSSNQHSRKESQEQESLTEAIDLLNTTQNTLQELHRECEFLNSQASPSKAALSPCALKLAISDMSQLMTAFGHIYHTNFKVYCQRDRPALRTNTSVFQSVHELLHTCNAELEAVRELCETSTTHIQTVQEVQTKRQFFSSGQKHTLPEHLEELKKKYTSFLSFHSSNIKDSIN